MFCPLPQIQQHKNLLKSCAPRSQSRNDLLVSSVEETWWTALNWSVTSCGMESNSLFHVFLFGFPVYGKFLPVLCWVTHFRFCYSSDILSNCTVTYLRFLFLCIFKPFPIKCFYGKAVKHRCDSVNKTLNQYGECIMCDTLYLKSLEFFFVFFFKH